jgi:SAM-dependent methyltransferase
MTYVHTEEIHNLISPSEIVPLIMEMVRPSSVLDVGCGIGTWLKAFEQLGVCNYFGVDGNYVDKQLLKIPADKFLAHDLRQPLTLGQKYDLVLSLEVAEHLEERYANSFIETICSHSDIVIFSAAIPGQGGQYHVNEQWLSYWVQKFHKLNYTFYDVLRPKIWNNNSVDVWYKQNIVIFCKNGHPLGDDLKASSSLYVDIVHPDLFRFYAHHAERALLYENGKLGVRSALRALFKSLAVKLS